MMDPALPQSPAMRIKQHMQGASCPTAWDMLLDSPLPPSPSPRSPFQHRLSPFQPRIANSYPVGAIGAVGAIGSFNPVTPHQMDFTSPGKVHIAGRLSQLRQATMQTGHEWQTIQQRHANERLDLHSSISSNNLSHTAQADSQTPTKQVKSRLIAQSAEVYGLRQ